MYPIYIIYYQLRFVKKEKSSRDVKKRLRRCAYKISNLHYQKKRGHFGYEPIFPLFLSGQYYDSFCLVTINAFTRSQSLINLG